MNGMKKHGANAINEEITQTFVIEGSLPGQKDMLTLNDRDEEAARKVRLNLRERIYQAVEQAGLIPMQAGADIHITWVCASTREAKDKAGANVYIMLDAFQRGKVIPLDMVGAIRTYSEDYKFNAQSPRAIVVLTGYPAHKVRRV